MTRAPDELETARLKLRRFTPADRDAYLAIRSQPEVAARLGYTSEEAEAKTEWFLGLDQRSWAERGHGVWAVCDRDDGALLGHAGLWYLPTFDAVEVLYGYGGSAWGRGLATEAARAVVEVAFGVLALERLIALAAPDNSGSLRVIEKLGFVRLREAEHRGYRVILHQLERPV
jgi:ribosomal-protein-alanine N-acetyltransferase